MITTMCLCVDCGQAVHVRWETQTPTPRLNRPLWRPRSIPVLCADCLEVRVWQVKAARPAPRQGSGQHTPKLARER